MTGSSPFRYDPAVLERFPAVVAVAIVATGVTAGPSAGPLREALSAAQAEARARLAQTPIAELPSIAAWRRAFTAFGTKPTQHRSAPEALLRRINGGDDVPSIDALVDTGNTISIRHALPVAVFDLARATPPLTVRFAEGGEPFDAVGGQEPGRCDPGEVVFVDGRGEVVARRWCWRQSRSGATVPGTTQALLVVEAQHAGGREDVDRAGGELAALVRFTQPAARLEVLRVP